MSARLAVRNYQLMEIALDDRAVIASVHEAGNAVEQGGLMPALQCSMI
jgi:hypothetical protein